MTEPIANNLGAASHLSMVLKLKSQLKQQLKYPNMTLYSVAYLFALILTVVC